jgi:hypothetical protein
MWRERTYLGAISLSVSTTVNAVILNKSDGYFGGLLMV